MNNEIKNVYFMCVKIFIVNYTRVTNSFSLIKNYCKAKNEIKTRKLIMSLRFFYGKPFRRNEGEDRGYNILVILY